MGCDGNLENLNKILLKIIYISKFIIKFEEIINIGFFLKSGLIVLLIVVCFSGDLNVVNELLKVGVDVNLGYWYKLCLIIVWFRKKWLGVRWCFWKGEKVKKKKIWLFLWLKFWLRYNLMVINKMVI